MHWKRCLNLAMAVIKPTMVPSSDEPHLGNHKKVQWALNLEEIIYYSSETEGKNAQPMLTKFKRNVLSLKNNRLAGVLVMWDREFLHWLQNGFESIVRKISRHSGEINIEKSEERYSEVFELYGKYKTGSGE